MLVSAVMLLGRAAGLPAARRAKRLAADAADRGFPGRLAVISAQPCFPASGGAEILFRVVDDPDAVVRLRVDRAPPSRARLAEAVEEGLAAVTSAAAAWLARNGPEASVAAVMSRTRLVPGRVDRLRVHVVFHDGPQQGRAALGDHVLIATTDLDGTFVGEPAVLRDVRDGTGPLRLPPL